MRASILFAALFAFFFLAPLALAEPVLEDKPVVECLTCNPRDEKIALGDPTFTLLDAPLSADDEYIMHPNESFDANLLLNDLVVNSKRGVVEYVPNSVWCDKGRMVVKPSGDFIYYPAPHWETDPLAWEDKDNWTTSTPPSALDYDGYVMCHYSTRWVGGEPSTAVAQNTVFLYAILTKINFVDNKKNLVPCEGDGTEENPFATLEEAMFGHNAVCTSSPSQPSDDWHANPGDIIHVASSSEPYYDGIALLDNNRLVCGGVKLISDDGRLLIDNGVRPQIVNVGGAAVELAQSNDIEGCVLTGSTYGVRGDSIVFPAQFHYTLIFENDYGFHCTSCDNEWYIGFRDGRYTEIIDSFNTAIHVEGGSLSLTISNTNVHSSDADRLVYWHDTELAFLLFDDRVNHFVGRVDENYFYITENDRTEIQILAGPSQQSCIPDDPSASEGNIVHFVDNVDTSLLVDTPASQVWSFVNCDDDGDDCVDTWEAAINIRGNTVTDGPTGPGDANVNFRAAIRAECGVAAIWIEENGLPVEFNQPLGGGIINLQDIYWTTNWGIDDERHAIFITENVHVVNFDIPISGNNAAGIFIYDNEEMITFEQTITFNACMNCENAECDDNDERSCIYVYDNTITDTGFLNNRLPGDPAVVFEAAISLTNAQYNGILVESNERPIHFESTVSVNNQQLGDINDSPPDVGSDWDGTAISVEYNTVPDTAPLGTPAVHFQAGVSVGSDGTNYNAGIGILIEGQSDVTGNVVFSAPVQVWNPCQHVDGDFCAGIYGYDNDDGLLHFEDTVTVTTSSVDDNPDTLVGILFEDDDDHSHLFEGAVTVSMSVVSADSYNIYVYSCDTSSYTFDDIVTLTTDGAGLVVESTDDIVVDFNDALSITVAVDSPDTLPDWGAIYVESSSDGNEFNFNDEVSIDSDGLGVQVTNNANTNDFFFNGATVDIAAEDIGIYVHDSASGAGTQSQTNTFTSSGSTEVTFSATGTGAIGVFLEGSAHATAFLFGGPVEFALPDGEALHFLYSTARAPNAWSATFNGAVTASGDYGVVCQTTGGSDNVHSLGVTFNAAFDFTGETAVYLYGDAQPNDNDVAAGTGIQVTQGGTWSCDGSCVILDSSSSYRRALSFTNVDATADADVAAGTDPAIAMTANLATGNTIAGAAVTVTGGTWASQEAGQVVTVNTGEYRAFTFSGVALGSTADPAGAFTFHGASTNPAYTVTGTTLNRSLLTNTFTVNVADISYGRWTCTSNLGSSCSCPNPDSLVTINWNLDGTSCVGSDDLVDNCPTGTFSSGCVDVVSGFPACNGNVCTGTAAPHTLIDLNYSSHDGLTVTGNCVDEAAATACPQ